MHATEPSSVSALPSGFEAQTVWGFHDPRERYAYELRFVYGPPSGTDERGPVAHLDRGRTYWLRTPLAAGDASDGAEAISYAEARRLWRRRLKFDDFTDLEEMRSTLPEAFAAG